MASLLVSETGKNISQTFVLYCNPNLLLLVDREREREFFAEGGMPANAGPEGSAGWRVSGATGGAGVQIPIWFVAQSLILLLALLTLPSASGPEKPFMLLTGETNTNACIREVTLDFHTDRFSFFFL